MCYYPYFRGKQYELITIRECATVFAQKRFIPIIEPVKGELEPLRKTLNMIGQNGAQAIVICNPQFGDYKRNANGICALLDTDYHTSNHIINGILLTEELSLDEALRLINRSDKALALIHAGFSHAKDLAENIQNNSTIQTNVFLEDYCGKLYRRHFSSQLITKADE